jgi:ketosteroid isomerase-like protein
MTIDLKPPLSSYFDASNAHDADAVAALFADDALVHDETADHLGRAAIRDWAQGTYDQYDVRLSPRETSPDGDATLVTTGVAGTFPGSPIELQFRFLIVGERIRELRIG